ncbi:MAG TPA: hypothetical protein VEC36_06395 [Patescibacteria group bacterium]|nr:hypothetical protein [Patescibacteria group bacterium]
MNRKNRFSAVIFLKTTLLKVMLLTMILANEASAQSDALSPILIGPYDGSDIVEQQVIWTWFMQSKAGGGADIFCDLIVAEILSGQTPEEALRQNPPVILRENLTTSAWQTGFNARELRDGGRYAWQVIAKVKRDGAKTAERAISRSEIWTFIYEAPKEVAEEIPAVSEPFLKDTALPPSSPAGEESHPDALSIIPSDSSEGFKSGEIPVPVTPVPATFSFNGKAQMTIEHSNQRPLLASRPPNYTRLQIDPTISIFGAPLRLNFLLSTESLVGAVPDQRDLLSRGAIGSQNLRRNINAALQQRVSDEIVELEAQRDSLSIDSLRTFLKADSLEISLRLEELYRLQETDLSRNMDALQQFGIATDEQRFLAQFPAFGFGNVAPRFGKMLLNDVTINGGFVEYNPGILYTAVSVGKIQRFADISNVSQDVIDQDSVLFKNASLSQFELFKNLYSVRLGIGKTMGNHVIITGLYAEDDEQSVAIQNSINRIRVDTTIAVLDILGNEVDFKDSSFFKNSTIVSQQRNYGIGAVAHYEPSIGNLKLDGEVNLMYFEDKGNFSALKNIEPVKNLPDFLRKGTEDSTIADYAFAIKAVYTPFANTANFSTGIRYVGGGYRSVGTAGLRTDALRWDGLYTQTLFKKQLRFSLNSSIDKSGYKDRVHSSDIFSAGAGLDVRIPKLPVLHFGYQRHAQALETNKNQPELRNSIGNTINNFLATAAYFYNGGIGRMSTFASYNLQNGESASTDTKSRPDSVGVFSAQAAVVSHQVSFSPVLSVNLTGNYSKTRSFPLKEFTVVNPDDSLDLKSEVRPVAEVAEVSGFGLSIITTPSDWFETTAGVTYFDLGKNSSFAFHSTTSLRFFKNMETNLQLSFRRLPNAAIPEEIVARLVNNFSW